MHSPGEYRSATDRNPDRAIKSAMISTSDRFRKPAHPRNAHHRRILHGLISLVMITALAAIGFVAIVRRTPVGAIGYLAATATGFVLILHFACSKCSCRFSGCGHLVPGPLTRLLPRRKDGNYTSLDMSLTAAGCAPLILFPQYWLSAFPSLFVAFWATALLLSAEIILFVCKDCGNRYCPVQERRNKHPPLK